MQAFCQNETVLVDALHLIIEGLIGCNGRVKRKGMSIGHEQVLNGRAEPGIACSLTFSVCMKLESEDLWDILRTGQFGIIKHKVRIQHGFLALKLLLRRLVVLHKNESPSKWRKEEMTKYKDFLLRCCHEIKPVFSPATPTPEDKHGLDVERESGRIAGADLDTIRDQRTMLRLILSKVVELAPRSSPDVPNATDTIPPISSVAVPLEGGSGYGWFDRVIASPAASKASPPAPAPVASPVVTMEQIWVRLGRIENSLEAVCANLPPASNLNLGMAENTTSGINHQQTSGTGTRTPPTSPNRLLEIAQEALQNANINAT
jgi:hypothetical protein